MIPYVIAWPVEPGVVDVAERRVPDVVGLSFRRAAARLHQVGLRVRIAGRGPVDAVEPAAGTKVLPGTLITLTGDGGNDHR
jgi:beta-lactam-binding protein with PASTA domain